MTTPARRAGRARWEASLAPLPRFRYHRPPEPLSRSDFLALAAVAAAIGAAIGAALGTVVR